MLPCLEWDESRITLGLTTWRLLKSAPFGIPQFVHKYSGLATDILDWGGANMRLPGCPPKEDQSGKLSDVQDIGHLFVSPQQVQNQATFMRSPRLNEGVKPTHEIDFGTERVRGNDEPRYNISSRWF